MAWRGKVNQEALLSLQGVRRVFDGGRVIALQGVDLAIRAGEFVVVVGPSGCGKSTLLHLLGALDQPNAGEARFGGEELVSAAARSQFRSRHVGFIFQSFHLLPTLTAIENVQVPMFEMPWSRSERRDRAESLLREVGLEHRLHHLPSELSGGERQRVAAARSLANEPRVLLADEPTGNLDSASAAQVLEVLYRIHCDRRAALVIATHDPSIARLARRVITMQDGKVLSDKLASAP
jgi:ABC-type lipoprotein export system ATPase subunit